MEYQQVLTVVVAGSFFVSGCFSPIDGPTHFNVTPVCSVQKQPEAIFFQLTRQLCKSSQA
jgi:hypothetical protein